MELKLSDYENILLVSNGKEYAFTPDEFERGMNRLARTAKRVKVPRKSHVALGHYECGECHTTVGAQDRFCKSCGTKLLDGLEDES